MQTDFEIITKFLARPGAEVKGRGSDLPDQDARVLVRKFAANAGEVSGKLLVGWVVA